MLAEQISSPIVDVVMKVALECRDNLSAVEAQGLRAALQAFVERRISYEDLKSISARYIDSPIPVEKIRDIMACAKQPVPDAPRLPSNIADDGSKMRRKTRSWCAHEDNRLIFAVHCYGTENWSQIAQVVGGGRTRSMCSQRWIRVLDPKICKTQWTDSEDAKLCELVQRHGQKSWMRVATEMGNRSDVQCRYRYQQISKEMPVKTERTLMPVPSLFCFDPLSSPEPAPKQEEVTVQSPPPALIEHELQLRLDEPFGLRSSFELFSSDPLFAMSNIFYA